LNSARKIPEPTIRAGLIAGFVTILLFTTGVVVVAAVGTSVPMASTTSADQKAKFVKYLHDDACPTFGTVLGPDANEAHKSHFHFDMKQRPASLRQ
jgi:Extensin-like protein C-terminus